MKFTSYRSLYPVKDPVKPAVQICRWENRTILSQFNISFHYYNQSSSPSLLIFPFGPDGLVFLQFHCWVRVVLSSHTSVCGFPERSWFTKSSKDKLWKQLQLVADLYIVVGPGRLIKGLCVLDYRRHANLKPFDWDSQEQVGNSCILICVRLQ